MRKLHKPTKVLEAEKREEGLNTALNSENKGFAMLQKMGICVCLNMVIFRTENHCCPNLFMNSRLQSW